MGKKMGLCGVVAVVAAVAMPAVSRAAIMVDDFSDRILAYWPQVKTTTDPSGLVYTDGPATGGVLGGWRGAGIVNTVMDVSGFDSVRADMYVGGGLSFLDYSSSSGGQGKIDLMYGSGVFGMGADLGVAHAAADAIRVTFLKYDMADGQPLSIQTLGLSGGNQTYLPTVQVTHAGAGFVDIPLASFWSQNAGGLNGLLFQLTAGPGADYRIDSITLVPEPASVAALAVAAGAMAIWRRRA